LVVSLLGWDIEEPGQFGTRTWLSQSFHDIQAGRLQKGSGDRGLLDEENVQLLNRRVYA
jgi:hypothetical protein